MATMTLHSSSKLKAAYFVTHGVPLQSCDQIGGKETGDYTHNIVAVSNLLAPIPFFLA